MNRDKQFMTNDIPEARYVDRFFIGKGKTDLNWMALFLCIINPNISPEQALVTAGLLIYKEGYKENV